MGFFARFKRTGGFYETMIVQGFSCSLPFYF